MAAMIGIMASTTSFNTRGAGSSAWLRAAPPPLRGSSRPAKPVRAQRYDLQNNNFLSFKVLACLRTSRSNTTICFISGCH